ncbi:AraC family transcriptional regulator [Paenibacillus harenae]|uniref:AraC family transcriptional regulator n=1 Tax=Paenibacillus harenae TaxID=306543 RepID=UPI00040A058C|nr:AraC family transcriptional regulator [Paenibacillus harenae]
MSYEESVERAIDYIEAHLGEELDLTKIAEESYASVAQLYRVFYALTGHPVKDYIRKRRMSVAANHLRNSKRTVEELAWESGFESYHAFAKVFKKIVGLTPAVYRNADTYFSFEPIRLREQVAYMEDREQTERFPDVKVIRFMPGKMYAYLHISEQEEGMENEAFRVVNEKLAASEAGKSAKMRIFGHNTDLPETDGGLRYGYKVLIISEEKRIVNDAFTEEPFIGGLYAIRKIAAQSPKTVQDGWNRLLSEWLPKSTFEIGKHQYMEEFIAYNGKVTRMNLNLPVQRKLRNETIEVVDLVTAKAFFCRGYGAEAQRVAEQRLIDWYERKSDGNQRDDEGKYYMSYHYGAKDYEEYWWENGILAAEPAAKDMAGLEQKYMDSGSYACCVSKTYGLLTGVLDQMHRWISANASYRLDDKRQWFAEYHTFQGMNIERDAIVKVYIPILLEESARNEQLCKENQ